MNCHEGILREIFCINMYKFFSNIVVIYINIYINFSKNLYVIFNIYKFLVYVYENYSEYLRILYNNSPLKVFFSADNISFFFLSLPQFPKSHNKKNNQGFSV